jgi:hypothetical protein
MANRTRLSLSPAQTRCKLVEATWLTDFPSRQVSSLSLYHMAKSRWEIENESFTDAKNRYGFEHTCHHEKTVCCSTTSSPCWH